VPPDTEHGNQASMRCPNNLLGIVTVACYDTEFSVVDGQCGDTNCPESFVMSNGAPLAHFEINNGWKAGPTDCPAPYEGVATFECKNGTTDVDEVTIQLPVSPEDWEAVAIGNETSADSRFLLCGCCLPLGTPPPAPPVRGRETGVFIPVIVVFSVVLLFGAAISGWYFLPRKKMSRVWPEKVRPPDPRPLREKAFEAILDQFQQALQDDPDLVKAAIAKNFKLQSLPDEERRLAIQDIMTKPQECKKYFTRRSVQHLLALQGYSGPFAPTSKGLPALGDGEILQITMGTPVDAWNSPKPPTPGQDNQLALGDQEDALRALGDAARDTSNKAKETISMKDSFKLYDRDGNGTIDGRELRYALEDMGLNLSRKKTRELLRKYDDNDNMELEYDEFQMLVAEVQANIDSEKERQADQALMAKLT